MSIKISVVLIMLRHVHKRQVPQEVADPKKGHPISRAFPIYVMVELFAERLANKAIWLITDNEALVWTINKQSSKNKYVMRLLRPMVLVLMRNNITFSAEHIQGKRNLFCDKLSRFQVPEEMLVNPSPWKRLPLPRHLQPGSLKA